MNPEQTDLEQEILEELIDVMDDSIADGMQ